MLTNPAASSKQGSCSDMGRRKPQEDFLGEGRAEEADVLRGRLKIFLGYASGVGKSFRMLDEARRRRERGQDGAMGAGPPQMPPEVDRLVRMLDIIPNKAPGVMDVEALLRRHPGVCVIDGLACATPPVSLDTHRR